MDLVGKARRVRIYVNEGDKVGWRPAHLAVIEFLRREHARGATVLRGLEGFGATGHLHVSHLVDVAQDLPVVIEWIDAPDVVERLLGRVKEMVPRGLITVDETEVVLYQPHPVQDLPVAAVADVMSRQVASVTRDAPLREVVELMLGKVYRAVPVVAAGVPVGMIANSDLVRRGGLGVRVDLLESLDKPEVHAILETLSSAGKVAGDVMTPGPVTVDARTPLPRVAEIMTHRRLKRLPVVDAHGALLGMVSRVDLLRAAAGGAKGSEPAARELGGLSGNVPLSTIMRRDVPTVHPDTPLPEVMQAVISTRLNRALVVDSERRVLGKVTDAEVLERLTPSLRSGALRSLMHRLPFAHQSADDRAAEQHARARRAAELMVRDVPMATEETLLSDAIALMLKGNHKLLAVTDASGALVGMVDRADLLHGLAPRD